MEPTQEPTQETTAAKTPSEYEIQHAKLMCAGSLERQRQASARAMIAQSDLRLAALETELIILNAAARGISPDILDPNGGADKDSTDADEPVKG